MTGGKRSLELRPLIAGGDRRSLARSRQALDIVRAAPDRVPELAALCADQDWLVVMRAFDLLEKLAHEHANWVQPYRFLFLGPSADADQWEIRLQVVRALPLLRWTARERVRVIRILRRNLEHPQTFVRAWALDGLAAFAADDARLRPAVEASLDAFERSGRKALRARAAHIRAGLREAPNEGAARCR